MSVKIAGLMTMKIDILTPVRRAAAVSAAYSDTKASRRTGSALTNRFLGRFSTNPNRCRARPRVDGGSSGNCSGTATTRTVPLQTGAPPSSSSWIDRCRLATVPPAPPSSTRLAAPRSARGGTSRLLKSQRRRTALRERRGPLANGMGIPFQRMGYCRRRPILRQQP